MIKKWMYLLVFLFFFGCMAGHKIMTMESFSTIDVGIEESQLKKKAGSPYKITTIDKDEKIYEYIERIEFGGRIVEERHYLFIIKDGRVTSKKMKFENLKDDRDAFELQTSSNK